MWLKNTPALSRWTALAAIPACAASRLSRFFLALSGLALGVRKSRLRLATKCLTGEENVARNLVVVILGLSGALSPGVALAGGNIERGAQIYRSCVACHALEPGLHLTGPSLGGVWNRPAGQAEGFSRYSDALRGAGFPWDAVALDAWLTNPRAMIAGTAMTFPGIPDAGQRADLIAFLEQAGRPGGAEQLVASGAIPEAYLRGPAPRPIGDAPDRARVMAIRHCGDGYTIETADGTNSVHWEKNIRLKIDSTETGPPSGIGVILGAGMQGDRYSVIFASVADLRRLVSENCATNRPGKTSK